MDKKDEKINITKLKPSEFLKILEKDVYLVEKEPIEETRDIEFKREPYKIKIGNNQEKQKIELVRDVTAMANSGGGIICIGIEQDESDTIKKSYSKKIWPIDKSLIDSDAWLKIIEANTQPNFLFDLIDFKFFGKKDELLIIEVKRTPEEYSPFLTTRARIIDNNTGEDLTKSNAFGCYSRNGSKIYDFMNSYEIWLRLNTPMIKSFQEKQNNKQFEKSKSVDNLTESKNKKKNYDFLAYAKEKLQFEAGFFYLEAKPNGNIAEIRNYWDKDSSIVYKSLEKPPIIREMGWDLTTAFQEKPYPTNGWWESMNGKRKLNIIDKQLRVFVSGTLDEFLEWGVKSIDGKEVNLNNFALVEFIDSFMHLLFKIKERYAVILSFNINYGFVSEKKINLERPLNLGNYFKDFVGPLSKKEDDYLLNFSEVDNPAWAAADVSIEIGANFGDADTRPYLVKVDGHYEVDEDLYRRQK